MAGYFPFQGIATESDKLTKKIEEDSKGRSIEIKVAEKTIANFLNSPERNLMLTGDKYYEGDHDILERKRMVIGEGGQLTEATNLPNNKRVDNQYAMLVDQKVNYLLAQPLTIETEDSKYEKVLKDVFDKNFHRLLKNIGKASLNHGLTWLHPYYDNGELQFKRFPAYEILPVWEDADHTKLTTAFRIYKVVEYEENKEVERTRVDQFTVEGIYHYLWENGKLIPDINPFSSYVTLVTTNENDELEDVQYFSWEKIPLIPFKYNSEEIPLIKRVKNLQDAYNKILSDFDNNMEENPHNTILIIENYDGEDLGHFRRNLAQYGAVKVRSVDGARGDVRTLEVTVNKDNYESILKIFKKAIIENGRGVDVKELRSNGNPNQMNIQSAYMDIDLDANGMETEFRAAFEELLWFINKDLANRGIGDFEDKTVNIIFNRDMLINETEVIEGLLNSPYLSLETRIAQHPYISDVGLELKRIKAEEQQRMNMFDNYEETFRKKQNGGEGDDKIS